MAATAALIGRRLDYLSGELEQPISPNQSPEDRCRWGRPWKPLMAMPQLWSLIPIWYGDAWEVECAGEKQAKERIEKMNE